MTGRIAVLEDNGDCRQILQLMFDPDYRVDAFETLSSLKHALTQTHFDILIADLMVGGEYGGLEILEYVRSNSSTAALPTILLTGDNLRFNSKSAMKLGFDGFMVKPFEFDELRQMVDKLIEPKAIPLDAKGSTAG